MKPLCTIIIPTIGRPKYFGPALASAAAQTYTPLSVLVSDNAANPSIELAEIRKWAPNANLRLVRREPKMTPSAHMNLCFQEAGGDYVMVLSDDDLIVPGYVSAAMDCILSDASVSVVLSRQEAIDENFLGPLSGLPITSSTLPGNEFVSTWFREGSQGVLTMIPMLARRQHILECGGLPEYPTGANSDNLLFFRLCLGAALGLLSGGYYYRVYPNSSGLAMPWSELVLAVEISERDIFALFKSGRLDRHTFFAMIRAGTRTLLARWKQLYRHRPGFENKICPLFDVLRRIPKVGSRYGIQAVPLVHKFLRHRP